MRITIELSEGSETIGRNGTFEIGALIILHTSQSKCTGHDLVFLDPVSRKRNILLNAGIIMQAEDMDKLTATWLEYRREKC